MSSNDAPLASTSERNTARRQRCDSEIDRPIRVLELRAADGAGGGPEKTIINGARLSSPEQFEIHILYLRNAGDHASEIADKAHACDLTYDELTSTGKFDREPLRRLNQYLQKHRIDIVHAHEYKSNLLAVLAGRQSDVRLLSTAHGWTGNSARERFIYYPVDRRVLRRFDRIVSVSSEITSTLVRSGVDNERITTIPNGIDAQQFAPKGSERERVRNQFGIERGDYVIGGVGRLARQKRFDLLIEACLRVRDATGAQLKLLIAGGGELEDALRQQIESQRLGDAVQLVGHVTDVRRFYAAIDLFVQASDYEGTSNAVLESMAMRVPVVATRAGGTADLIEDDVHGILVPVGSLESLVSAIRSCYENPDLASRLAAEARSRVEGELSFSRRNEKLESIYRELLFAGSAR